MNTIGKRIKELRESKGLSIDELCLLIGFDISTYTMLEKDEKSIDTHELRVLTKFYNVSADYVLGINSNNEDIEVYLKDDKHLNDSDIAEILMVLSIMDEAIVLKNMKELVG